MTDTSEPRDDWRDQSLPPATRAALLLRELTLEERVAQLGSEWPGEDTGASDVAPMHDSLAPASAWPPASGTGHLTRPFGTFPQKVADGVDRVVDLQSAVVASSRLGVPAIVHEECLTGFTTWGATIYPTAMAWSATWDPDLIEQMANAIGSDMAAVGVHQGLAPVLDVVRDYRWGRVEETLGEDPYLAGSMGSAYVRGLQSAGVIATLKHFVGYSASRTARNHAPISMGQRELRDIMLVPFEMAVRAGARSVMNAYTDIDGVPTATDSDLLSGVLRDEWGFDGTVVSDYWSVPFVRTMHRVAETPGEAGALTLGAGIDVELPQTIEYGDALHDLVATGRLDESFVDRAALRVLTQKVELGLLDADWTPQASVRGGHDRDLDGPANRQIARTVAERSIVLLADDSDTLPLASPRRIAVVGPCADDVRTLFGCYSYPNHVLPRFPDVDADVPDTRSLLAAIRIEFDGATIDHHVGVPLRDPDTDGIAPAVAAAHEADLVIAAVGDRAGMFGQGTSGEGCDVADLSLPGSQHDLLDALLGTGTPVVVIAVTGRPYALGRYAGRAAALVQAFMPGVEGAGAIAGVLSGRIVPSGRLPVQIPTLTGAQPSTYLQAPLGHATAGISSLDPTPAYPFGHGLSYTSFAYDGLRVSADELPTDGSVDATITVTNTGARAGAEVVQLYHSGPRSAVVRPERALLGFARVMLDPGEAADVTFTVAADRLAVTDRTGKRAVDPGTVSLLFAASAADVRAGIDLPVTGSRRIVGPDRALTTPAAVAYARAD